METNIMLAVKSIKDREERIKIVCII